MVIVVVEGHAERVEKDVGRYEVVKLTVFDHADHELARLIIVVEFTAEGGGCFADDAPIDNKLTWFKDSSHLCCH